MTAPPLPRASGARDSHVVVLHRDERHLERAVTAWVADALGAKGGAILISTPDRAARVLRSLDGRGLDAPALQASGRLAVVDAEGLMTRFMSDGMPEPLSFLRLVDALARSVRNACASPQAPVRAWGEMVDILAQRGDFVASRALEDLWNEAIQRTGVDLLCSYRFDNLEAATHGRILRDVCHGHVRLVPEENEPFFERALESSLRNVAGEDRAKLLWDRFSTRPPLHIRMPVAEAVLVGLHSVDPGLAGRVVAELREAMREAQPG